MFVDEENRFREGREEGLYNSPGPLTIHCIPTFAESTCLKKPINSGFLATPCVVCALFYTPPARFVRGGVVARGPRPIEIRVIGGQNWV